MRKEFNELDHSSDVVSLYATGNYSGTDADLDNTAPVSDSDGYTANIDLTKRKGVKVTFKFDASGATDNLLLKLYDCPSGTWDGDEILVDQIEVTSDGSEDIYVYTITESAYGPSNYRFSLQSSAGNDTFDIEVLAYFWDKYEG